jgi:hypothetical protein
MNGKWQGTTRVLKGSSAQHPKGKQAKNAKHEKTLLN